MIAYISGHLDLTVSEFYKHYRDVIDKAILAGDDFIVGDAIGTDWIAQTYLLAINRTYLLSEHSLLLTKYPKVKIYHMLESPRCYYTGIPLVGGFKSDEERDAAMTMASDYDIAWVRPGRENSGTAKNLVRRKK